MSDALKDLVAAAVNGGLKGRRGRGNSPLGSRKKRLAVAIRQQTVQAVLEWQKRSPDDPLRFTSLGTRRAMELGISGALDHFASTLGAEDEGPFGAAALILQGHPVAQGTWATIEDDYKKPKLKGVFGGLHPETDIRFQLADASEPLRVPQSALDALRLSPEVALRDLNWVALTGT